MPEKKNRNKNVPAKGRGKNLAAIVSEIAKGSLPENLSEIKKRFFASPQGREFLSRELRAIFDAPIAEISLAPKSLFDIRPPEMPLSILPDVSPHRESGLILVDAPSKVPPVFDIRKPSADLIVIRPAGAERVSAEIPLLDLPIVQTESDGEKFAREISDASKPPREFFDAGPADKDNWPAKGDSQGADPDRVESFFNSPSLQDLMDLHREAQDSISPFEIMKGEITGIISEPDGGKPTQSADEEKPELIAGMLREQEEMARMFFPEKIEAGIISTGDFKDLKIPPRLEGKHIHHLFVLPKGFDALEAWKSVATYTRFGKRAGENDFVWSIVSKRSSAAASYVFWADERLNCDRALEGHSLREIKANRLSTMTFEERCWHDLYHLFLALKKAKIGLKDYNAKMFEKITGKHFLFDESTLCLDSRVTGHKDSVLTYMRCSSVLSVKLLDPSILSDGKNAEPHNAEEDLPENEKRRPSIHASPPRAHRVSAEFAPLNPDFAPKPAF